MSRKIAGPEIERLVQLLARLPGLGPRSARKAVLALLKRRNDLLLPLAEALQEAVAKISECPVCGNLDTVSPCSICQDTRRDQSLIVVVEEVGDLWALERAGVVAARYHVLGGHLSPLDGIGPEQLNIASLVTRVQSPEVREFCWRSTPPSKASRPRTTFQISSPSMGVTVSRLAQGVPIGGELDYLDDGTLAAAFKARRKI